MSFSHPRSIVFQPFELPRQLQLFHYWSPDIHIVPVGSDEIVGEHYFSFQNPYAVPAAIDNYLYEIMLLTMKVETVQATGGMDLVWFQHSIDSGANWVNIASVTCPAAGVAAQSFSRDSGVDLANPEAATSVAFRCRILPDPLGGADLQINNIWVSALIMILTA